MRCAISISARIPAEWSRRISSGARPASSALRRRRPLDEGDRVGAEVVVEQRRVLALEARRAGRGRGGRPGPGRRLALADREGRRGDRRLDPERPAGAADQRRLAGADLAADDDDVTRAEARGDRAPSASVSAAELLAGSPPRSTEEVELVGGVLPSAPAPQPPPPPQPTLLGARAGAGGGPASSAAASRSRRAASPSSPACAAPPPGGRAAAGRRCGRRARAPAASPGTRVIPVGLPLAAWSRSCRACRRPSARSAAPARTGRARQASISGGCGSRLPGGRDFSTLAMKTSSRESPISSSSWLSS